MVAMLSTREFNRLVDATKKFISTNDTNRVNYTYIRMEFSKGNGEDEDDKVLAVAVDGYRLLVESGWAMSVDESFTVYIKPNFRFPSVRWPKDDYCEITLSGDECIIRGGGFVYGYKQPKEPENFLDWKKAVPDRECVFRYGINPKYLIAAVQAAAVRRVYNEPIVLEFYGENLPMTLRLSGSSSFKMVLPVRLKDREEKE